MVRFTPKQKTIEPTKDENTIDTKLELQKYATQVQSNIKTNITSDFTLCKLNDQDKEGITNMTVNAYAAKRLITQIQKQEKTYKWQNNQWITQKEENKELIKKKANEIFDMYMIKVQMTAVLNRNVPKNYLINFLKEQQEPEQEQEPTNEKKIQQRIIKDKEKKEANE